MKSVYQAGDRGLDIARKLARKTKRKVTASAVIGFFNRNKEALKDYPLSAQQDRAPSKPEPEPMKLRLKRKPEPHACAPLPVRTEDTIAAPTDLFVSKKIPLLKLEPRQCRWGTHETVADGHLFCGHRTKFAESYCEHHRKLSQQKTYKEMRAEEARLQQAVMVPLMIEGPTNAQAA